MHHHGGDIYRHQHVTDFSANMNFRGMPESVQTAAQEAVLSCGNYPDPSCSALREAIARREGAAPRQVICGNGAAELIFSLALAKKPRRALILAPTFYEYEQALRVAGCETERHYLKESEQFVLKEDILERICPGMDVVFLCNPNNPTGELISPRLLSQILAQCICCRTLLVVDECFLDFVEDSERFSMKQYLGDCRSLFVLKAFTKLYAMAGLRLGYGLCSDETLLHDMQNVRQPWSVSIPAQQAGIAAAAEVEFAEESRRLIGAEREFLRRELMRLGYPVVGSKANYLFFKGPVWLFEACLQAGFLIRDCGNYEGLVPGWYRIAVRSREENLALLQVLEREGAAFQAAKEGAVPGHSAKKSGEERSESDGKGNYGAGNDVQCGEEPAGGRAVPDF